MTSPRTSAGKRKRTPRGGGRGALLTYDQRLDEDFRLVCREGDAYFAGASAVHRALRRLAQRLDELGIPYATIGAMAMSAHGFRRFTHDVDVVVVRDSLQRIHAELEGRGYRTPFAGSKNLIDTEHGVRIDLVVAGEFPGDGEPKPVAFPDPSGEVTVVDGVRYVSLETLVELKLASGMSNPQRLRDLGDVQSMIHDLKLPREFGQRLHPSVRAKFDEFWLAHENDPRRDEF